MRLCLAPAPGPVTDTELRGRALFRGKARCTTCHVGANLTDERFHNVGHDLSASGNLGRAAITGRDADRGRFKTPTLHGLRHTTPYFHDGSQAALADVIDFYNEGGDSAENRDRGIQPLGLSPAEALDLEAYLLSLSAP